MANVQSGSNDKNKTMGGLGNSKDMGRDSKIQGQDQKGQMSSTSQGSQDFSGRGQSEGQGDALGQLQQFVGYVRENWKTILSELVAAGVSAYLTHSKSGKSAKPETRQ